MTKLTCKSCNGHGVTSPAGKAYRNPANAVASVPCKACKAAPAKSTGFVKAKIRAAKEAKLAALKDELLVAVTKRDEIREAKTVKATVKVTPAAKRVTVTMSESEYAAFAAMMNTPRTASGRGRRTSKATPNSKAATTSTKTRKA